jgi:hypothetical protein
MKPRRNARAARLLLIIFLSFSAACAFFSPAKLLTDLLSTATPTTTPSPSSTPTPLFTYTPTITATVTPTTIPGERFTFAVNSDPHDYTGDGDHNNNDFFRGVCQAIDNLDQAHFMVTVGDLSPVSDAKWTIDRVFGGEFLWFPVVGNHEFDDKKIGINALKKYNLDPNGDVPPNLTRRGPQGCPETTYSFDYGNSHFVMLNLYCDTDRVTDGAMVDVLLEWLEADLAATDRQHIFVFGHEPAYPLADVDNEQERHVGDSLDQYPVSRDRFWKMLADYGVLAYFSGHTHTLNAVKIDGVWQINDGHATGKRTLPTLGSFLMVHVDGDDVWVDMYRAGRESDYTVRYVVNLTE